METTESINLPTKPIVRPLVPAVPLNQIGYWSSMASLIFGLGYAAAQLLSWLQVIVYPHDLFWLFLPSLFLAPCFLIAMVCLHYKAREEHRIWTAIGIAFAIIYCTMATLTYFTQLGAVVPSLISGKITDEYAFIFKPRSFTMSIDCLGYFFMSLSTLFTGVAYRSTHKKLYRWFLFNGLLILILVPAYFNPFLYYIGSVWILTFSLSMIYSARVFI